MNEWCLPDVTDCAAKMTALTRPIVTIIWANHDDNHQFSHTSVSKPQNLEGKRWWNKDWWLCMTDNTSSSWCTTYTHTHANTRIAQPRCRCEHKLLSLRVLVIRTSLCLREGRENPERAELLFLLAILTYLHMHTHTFPWTNVPVLLGCFDNK